LPRLQTVAVSDPQKQLEGMKSFITYKVTAVTAWPGMTETTFTVIRRYSDFTWLHGVLERECPGAIIPPLPEKNTMNRFEPAFLEGRRKVRPPEKKSSTPPLAHPTRPHSSCSASRRGSSGTRCSRPCR